MAPLDQLEHERAVFEPVDLRYIGMIERCEHLRFTMKARQAVRVAGKCLGQDLDRHFAVQQCVASAIDLAHAASTDGSDDPYGTRRAPGETLIVSN